MKIRQLIISILIALGVGGLSSIITGNNQKIYSVIDVPSFAPPSFLFPIVWTILFILMGISAYLIYISNSKDKGSALTVYGLQLIINFFWSIIFFNLKNFLFAFIWIILLIIFIIIMILKFYKIDKRAAYLQIPYLLWTLFASILTLSIYLMN